MRSRNHFRLREKKRYEARRFHNPYFQSKPRRNWKLIVLGTGVGLAAVCLVSFVFGSPYFAIASVTVAGTETISSDEIVGKAWAELNRRRLLFFRATNRFLYEDESLRAALSGAYAFDSLEVSRTCSWTHGGCSVAIQVKEKTSQLLWVSGDHVFLADLKGVAIRELTPDELAQWSAPDPTPLPPNPDGSVPPTPPPSPLKRLPIFEDVNAATVPVGSNVMTETEITNLFRFQSGLSTMGIGFTRTRIDRLAGKWMAVHTTVGYDVFVDAVGNIDMQLTNLTTVLHDKIPDPTAIQYIDLRFGDHVYYK